MLKIGKKTSDPPKTGDTPDSKEGGWFKQNQHSLIIAAILIVAFAIRFVFAYGLSAGSDYALSGGSSASEHLRTISEIVSTGFNFGADGALNYPFGTASTNPPLLDLFLSLFAFIFKAAGMEPTTAAAAALSWSAVIFGTLACIPMYLLGKEMLGSRTAGYLAALFLALCPIVISQTVFSNGTDIAFVSMMVIFLVYFLYKGISLMENPVEGKNPMKYSGLAALIMVIVALSYTDIRPLLVMMIICMAVAVLIDRFRSKNPVRSALFYSIPVLCGAIAGTVYFVLSGHLSGYIGIVLVAAVGVVLCMSFAALHKVPWTVTVPVYVIVTIAAFVALAIFMPQYFNQMVSGPDFYAEGFGSLVSTSVSLSSLATYFGFATLWFAFLMIIYRLFKIGKNIGSPTYVFILVWMIVSVILAISSVPNAVLFASSFAIGFAAVIIWIVNKVDLKGYFSTLKGPDFKSTLKRIFRPLPFLTVIAIVVIICVPNVVYALDSGVANNDTNNPLNQKAVGYYVKTDSDWVVNDVFKSYADVEKDGALVTWMDYSYDAAAYGNFNVITNSLGNGSTAMANILLSNAVDGSSVAAMLIYLIKYYGVDASRTALTAVMTDYDFAEFKTILTEVTDDDRKLVLSEAETYGILRTDVSDENVTYIRGIEFLTEKYSSYDISVMYEKLETETSKKITYVMVTGSMFPVYYGYSSTFATMAYMNGYAFSDDYGTVAQFLKTDFYTQYYTGTYAYTDAMYDTLLWRAYIGKSPAEAGYTGTYDSHTYIQKLMLSDGTVKATPGYGLGSFEVDFDYCYVEYNARSDATLSSDGWVKMLYNDAIEKQNAEGGLINYLSGYPVVLKYVNSSTGTAVSGKVVSHAGDAVKSITVVVTDEAGMQRSTVQTKEDGSYTVMTYGPSVITFSAGGTTAAGGTAIKTVNYTEGTTLPDVEIPQTSLTGTIEVAGMEAGIIKLFGKTSEMEYSGDITAFAFSFDDIVPDTYEIVVYDESGKVELGSTEYKVTTGVNNGLKVALDTSKATITVKDEAGVVLPDIVIKMDNGKGIEYVSDATDADGVAEMDLLPGTYTVSVVTDGYITNTSSVTVTKGKDQSVAVTAYNATSVDASVESGIVSAIGYQTSFGNSTVKVPVGTAGEPVYGVYYASAMSDNAQVFFGTTATANDATTTGYLLTGKIVSSSDSSEAVTGWIAFIDRNNAERMVTVQSGSTGYKVVLPEGQYNVYATNNTSVCYYKLDIAGAGDTKDFVLGEATTVSGVTCWQSTSYKLAYMPLDVTVTIDNVSYDLNVISGHDGSYKFLVPKNAVYTIKSDLKNEGAFFYGTTDAKEYSKTLTGGGNFTATAEKITITNANSFQISVTCGGTTKALKPFGEEGNSAEFNVTSTSMTVKVNRSTETADPNTVRYYSSSMPVEPGKNVTVNIEDKVETDKIVKFTSDEDITLTITCDDADGKSTAKTANKEYYLKDGFVYKVKATTESGKIGYTSVDLTVENPELTVPITVTESITVSGYVGFAADGTIIVNDNEDLRFAVSSGSYEIVIPVQVNGYEFTATVSNDTCEYTATASPTEAYTAGNEYTFNMAVTGGPVEEEAVNEEEAKATLELDIIEMSPITEGFKTAEIKFSALLTAPLGAPTYTLSGGSSWTDIQFYSDADCTQQITSVNGSKQIYGKGVISTSTVAITSANLTVIVNDINGEEVCKEQFDKDDANWQKTATNKSIISHGVNGVNYAEYEYGISIENKDNYVKSFELNTQVLLGGKWFITAVDGDDISSLAGGVTVSFEVPGYETKTIYVKMTSIDGSTSDVPDITSSVKALNGALEVKEGETGITLTGDTASVVSVKATVDASVDLSISGRGMVTDQGSMPVYEWVLMGVIVLLVILVIWLGIRRGVFTRKN